MVTVNTIVSAAQNAIFDLEMSRVQEGEWVDMLNSSLVEVGKRTQGYVRRIDIIPRPLITDPEVWTAEIPADTSPYVLTRVVRITEDGAAKDCEEISTQALLNTQQSRSSFQINRAWMYEGSFSTKLVNVDDEMDNTMTLNFAKPFDVGEQITVDYIGLKPVNYQIWQFRLTPPLAVPDYFEAALKYSLFYHVFELLFNRGDQFYYSRMQNAMEQYEKHITELAAYSRLLRNRGDVVRIRPVNWLPEA